MRKFLARVDAGQQFGFGHALRCLSLARWLRSRYGICTTFCSNPYDKFEQVMKEDGFDFILNQGPSECDFLHQVAQQNPDSVLLVDKLYSYDGGTIRALRDKLRIVMLHNECDGMFESDFAIFPSAHLSDAVINDPRWDESPAEFRHGPEWVLIGQQTVDFVSDRKQEKDAPPPFIVLTTGASDPQGVLVQLLRWVAEAGLDAPIKALFGFDFAHHGALSKLATEQAHSFEIKAFNHKDLLSSRLAVCTFGVTAYELIYANVPVLTVGHIPKNAQGSKRLQQRYGCNIDLGLVSALTGRRFSETLTHYWNSVDELEIIRRKQAAMIDGGAVSRIGNIIHDLCVYGGRH